MSETMKILDERETQKKRNKQTKTERNKEDRRYSKRVIAKWFCCACKLGFLQLILKASLHKFKSNLELASSIILKQRKLWVKACSGWV